MKLGLIFACLFLSTSACRAQPPSTIGVEVDGAKPVAVQLAATTKVAKPSKPALEELAKLPWIGDASVNMAKASHGRYGLSGYWQVPEGDRRAFQTASFEQRHGAATGTPGYVLIDASPAGLQLKLYEGSSFTPADVHFEMPVVGDVTQLTVEMGIDKLALLTWDGAKPRLTMYRQGAKEVLWMRELPIEDRVGACALALHPSGEVTVEWRSATNYKRLVVDGASGEVWLTEELNPLITKAVLDPIGFMRGIPASVSDVSSDPYKETATQRIIRSPEILTQLCPAQMRERVIARAIEFAPGLVLAVGAIYASNDRDGTSDEGDLGGGRCAGVVVMNTTTLAIQGRWTLGL